MEIPSHSYGVSLAVWDHTVLPATWHKRTHPASTPVKWEIVLYCGQPVGVRMYSWPWWC